VSVKTTTRKAQRVASIDKLQDWALRCWVLGHYWDDREPIPFDYYGFKAGLLVLTCGRGHTVRRDVLPPKGTAAYDKGEVWTRRYIYGDDYLLAFPATRKDLRHEFFTRFPYEAAEAA
jgi:hypothetical protein